ncbi:FctA domain-containing protein, partial [Enterococcus casseliflavus]
MLDEQGEVLQTKTNDANGKIYFDAIDYDQAGTYKYTIREVV